MIKTHDIINNIYEVLEPIGSGGVGTIFRARHLHLNKDVVIKMIHSGVQDNINTRAEADILKSLTHSYLPTVYDYIQIDNAIYTVLDYIPGKDLESYMKQGCVFTQQQLFKWFYQLCEALNYLHSQTPPIIHSDIKPANIMIRPNGNICLIDFNVSFYSSVEAVQGFSPHYASPEQITYANQIKCGMPADPDMVDVRTDIYSLGATFYYLMTRIVPEQADGEVIPITDYELPKYADSFIEIIERCMRVNPAHRFQSSAKLLQVLNRIEGKDKRILGLKIARRISNILLLFGVVVGALFMYYGFLLMRMEKFDDAYQTYIRTVKNYNDPEQVITYTEDFLEQSDTKMALNREKNKYYLPYYYLANAYAMMEEYQKADNYYKSIVSFGEPPVYLEYAILKVQMSDYEGALALINDGLKRGLDYGRAYYGRGLVAYARGDNDEASLQFKKARTLLEDEELISKCDSYLENLGK